MKNESMRRGAPVAIRKYLITNNESTNLRFCLKHLIIQQLLHAFFISKLCLPIRIDFYVCFKFW